MHPHQNIGGLYTVFTSVWYTYKFNQDKDKEVDKMTVLLNGKICILLEPLVRLLT